MFTYCLFTVFVYCLSVCLQSVCCFQYLFTVGMFGYSICLQSVCLFTVWAHYTTERTTLVTPTIGSSCLPQKTQTTWRRKNGPISGTSPRAPSTTSGNSLQTASGLSNITCSGITLILHQYLCSYKNVSHV